MKGWHGERHCEQCHVGAVICNVLLTFKEAKKEGSRLSSGSSEDNSICCYSSKPIGRKGSDS